MYLSRVTIDPKRRDTMRAMASPQIFHGAIEQCTGFPASRNLWRIDKYDGAFHLLFCSESPPILDSICSQFGFPDESSSRQTKDYTPLMNRLEDWQTWQFRFTGNPVRSTTDKGEPKGPRGKIHAHVTIIQQKKWLMDRASQHGFIISEDSFDVVHAQWLLFGKGSQSRQNVSIHAVTFEGTLVISDVSAFKEALAQGIGRSKAYGCGLMTIMQPQEAGNA